jgi:hypothetical protein
MTNTQAYYCADSITTVKRFMVQATVVVNVKTSFMLVTRGEN